ncbi:hypothetical protein FE257_003714 [Aspergillus nanangensis]|uniref:DUF2428 domain-containing protein n=1 Tax=Aspergillus nanangensis TaxID=2582783 RepID=A0AAD4GWB3_ASPNN|nr:hypothetical protein FE257_003714 [Aspergillus nanangensis]
MDVQSGSDGQDGAGHPFVENISREIQVLSEETLKQLRKGPLVKKVNRFWGCLFKTYATASTSQTHTTASCNGISSFLDTATVSKVETTRQLAFSEDTWISVFEVYMTRSKDSKPKPMKQVLESLIGLLAKNPQAASRDSIRSKVADIIIPGIILGEPRARLKASLTALEALLRKSAILPTGMISLVQNWLLQNPTKWVTLLEPDCKALSINLNQYLQQAPATDLQRVTADILLLRLLNQTQNMEISAAAGDCISIFFQKLKSQAGAEESSRDKARGLVSVWAAPVRHMILQDMQSLDSMSNYVLQPLFSIDSEGFRRFVDGLHLNSLLTADMTNAPLAEFTLLFASLHMAKKIGLVHEDHYFSRAGASNDKSDTALVLDSAVLGQFLFHREFSIRIAALSLLITAPVATKPVSFATMKAVLKGLPSMHAESNSYSRGEILSLVRKFIIRLKGGILSQAEDWGETIPLPKKQQANVARDESETHASLREYIEFLKSDLRPTATYPRHITALRSLNLLLDSGLDARFPGSGASKPDGVVPKWKSHMDVFDPSLLRLLVDLLLDPYDDVRATAMAIVKQFPMEISLGNLRSPSGGDTTCPQIIDALYKAEQLASNTSRADHADCVARLYQIVFSAALPATSQETAQWWDTKWSVVDTILKKLESKLSVVGGLFNASMRDAPLHGYISALRYIVLMPNFYVLVSEKGSSNFADWRLVHSRIVAVCDRIWNEVKPILCIDSPEGHTDDPAEELGVGPKDILSYSWRGLRESSLLLYATIMNESYGPKGEEGLSWADFEKIGSMSFTQLAELRHRGAFSTVSQTFATCCLRCGKSKDPQISALPEHWYEEARKIIFESASKLTRRSAGLPALATGILHSKPGGPLFQKVIHELHKIAHLPAEEDSQNKAVELPQVHAINCLKDIFTNNRLGPHTEPFMMSGLNLSAERIGSPIWDLRNSGMMLFRALLNRMCRTGSGVGFGGVSGSEPGGRISFGKYPGLIELLSGLLTSKERNSADHGDHAIITERVFPALELLAEKVPNVYGIDDTMLRGLVRDQLKSPVWGMREHAARVYASLMHPAEIVKNVEELIDIDQDAQSQDYLHGKALCIKYSLRRLSLAYFSLWKEQIHEVSALLRKLFTALFPRAESPFVATALLEILSDAVEKAVESEQEEKLLITLTYIYDVHGLHDILENLFNSSSPSWKFLSTTRASSLLRRALSWVAILQAFIEGEVIEVEPFLNTVSKFDSNVGTWLLGKIQDTFGVQKRHHATLLSIYSSVILGDYPEEVKSSATVYIADVLSSRLSLETEKFTDISLPWEALDKYINSDHDGLVWNRDRSDAALHLQGCLLAAKDITNSAEITPNDVHRWTTKLRFAMEEETEYTTRSAAMVSLRAFGPSLRTGDKPPRMDQMFLDIYLVLYDMLNDDDDELRDVAASTASWVLSYSSVSPKGSVILSPLNASEALSQFIADNYSESSLLRAKAIRYITGQGPRINGSTHRTQLTPVSTIVAELMKDSTILFEEEKQNLFIENVREIDLWSLRLRRLSATAFSEQSARDICKWAIDGISCLSQIASSQSGHDGLMGWASKSEMYCLGIRLISLAAVLVSKDFTASVYIGESQNILKAKLEDFLQKGKAALVRDDWLVRVQHALDSA